MRLHGMCPPPSGTGLSLRAQRVVDHDLLPGAAALLAEAIVHGMHLVGVVRRLVGEGDDERVRVAPIDDLTISARRRADEALVDRLDRGERADAVDEAGGRLRGEV